MRLIDASLEGTALRDAPAGCFGFTTAPAVEGRPVFRRQIYQSFEVHKLTDGSAHLIGYVTEDQARMIEGGARPVNCRLYPDQFEDAAVLVSISLDGTPEIKGPSRNSGNYVNVEMHR